MTKIHRQKSVYFLDELVKYLTSISSFSQAHVKPQIAESELFATPPSPVTKVKGKRRRVVEKETPQSQLEQIIQKITAQEAGVEVEPARLTLEPVLQTRIDDITLREVQPQIQDVITVGDIGILREEDLAQLQELLKFTSRLVQKRQNKYPKNALHPQKRYVKLQLKKFEHHHAKNRWKLRFQHLHHCRFLSKCKSTSEPMREEVMAVAPEEPVIASPKKKRRLLDVEPALVSDVLMAPEIPSREFTGSAVFLPQETVIEPVMVPLIPEKNRQQEIVNKVFQSERDRLTLEELCSKPINKLNVARTFNDLLVLCRSGYVKLISENSSFFFTRTFVIFIFLVVVIIVVLLGFIVIVITITASNFIIVVLIVVGRLSLPSEFMASC
ncbi:hypothetical protein BDFB_004701 [Asbolus verrucosus]|uniref:Uncharacterized protein n=1 Tax=Asbolus verrucosus TaxID=1661398 RepID=A0A482W4P5_ASBVE|nr:hypothetical protein BDFB_004701 [Asbolus verrucosus]